MESRFPREGVLVALILPFDANGRLMESALAEHLQWLRERGVHGVLALGSTGEFPLLSIDQRKAALEAVARLADPLPVIANISDNNPAVVAELGRYAHYLELPGVAIMPPGFFPATAADQLEHFLYAAEVSALPVMLYNFPERTGTRIAAETVEAFAERAPMAAIKQSGGEFDYHRALIALGKEKDFSVFSGADTRLPEAFRLGAAGCIGGLVNMVPELMLEQFRVFRKGEAGQLEPTASRLKEVGAIVDRLTFPENCMAGLRARGFDPGVPKRRLSRDTLALSEEVTSVLREKFVEWGLPLAPVPA
jgi:4-hydroxy-tetrahydrodipicolinate synthase